MSSSPSANSACLLWCTPTPHAYTHTTHAHTHDKQEFLLTTTSHDLAADADLARLTDGQLLLAVPTHASGSGGGGPVPAAPVRERISFTPHPKTMTRAGDYEYFAAQVFACH